MRICCCTLLFALFSVFLPAQEIFLSTLNGLLYSLDLSDCSFQQTGVMPVSSTDISFHPNGNLYSITGGGSISQIDPTMGTSTLIHSFGPGPSQLYTALTVSAEGVFYANGLGGDLWAYDLATDIGTFLGNTGFGAEGDLTFYEGNLYMASENDNIVLVDIENPTNSTIAINSSVPGRIFGIVSFAESCEDISVYALTDNAANVYEVNFMTNTLELYCSIPLEVSGGASTFEFLGSNPVFIDDVVIDGFICGQDDGSLTITASGGVGALTYSLNGTVYQTSPDFTNLALTTYTVYVADEVGCVRTQEITPEGDLPIFEEVGITNTTCENDNGEIEVMVSGGLEPYTFYVNGTLVPGLSVDGLANGNYQLEVVDAAGCSVTSQANIGGAAVPTIANTTVVSTSCGEDNGSLSFIVAGGVEPFSFSLDGGPAQSTGVFSNLAPGEYVLTLNDLAGCTATTTATILPSTPLNIIDLQLVNAICGEEQGAITVQTTGGQFPIFYRLDGQDATSDPSFTGLSAGMYLLEVIDAVGCTLDTTVVLEDRPPVSLQLIAQQAAACLSADGSVMLGFSGGTGPLQLKQNGQNIALLAEITALAAGDYQYTLNDSLGCTDTLNLVIGRDNCPIYLPNVFSPNLDGANDYFAPQSVSISSTQILRMEIYDRWGGQVFTQESGAVDDAKFRWDGTCLGSLMTPGIYVYFIELQYAEGAIEVLSGDVLLLR